MDKHDAQTRAHPVISEKPASADGPDISSALESKYLEYALQNFRIKEAARELRCSPATIFRRFQDGSLNRIKVGGTTLVSGADILRFRGIIG